jgi:hypothetical protein
MGASDHLILRMNLLRLLPLLLGLPTLAQAENPALHAGAAKIDISPLEFPVIRNGGFIRALDHKLADPLHARSLVLYEKTSGTRVAITIVDSCMIPRSMCDAIKKEVHAKTGIAHNRILIAATHTHSAPSVMHYCLGTEADPKYSKFLPPKVVESIVAANDAVQPAKAGWATFDARDFTKTRRWITRTDRLESDPFGNRSVHAMMHPGFQNPNYIGESGPPDPWFSLLSLQTMQGKPLALLGNFSMHYFSGHSGTSADYYGEFCRQVSKQLAPGDDSFVALLSQGTSGDAWRRDYGKEKSPDVTIQAYTASLVTLAREALQEVNHRHHLPLAMEESRLTLQRRTPDEARLAWARKILAAMEGRRSRNRPEVYAEQAVFLHENPQEEIVLQAIRLGELGLTAIPNEVYALTGLQLKKGSPLDTTANLSLANGAAGYIPSPEQHHLGGYTTWPARTAGLEVEAEPKIVAEVFRLLEKASGKKRRPYREPGGPYHQSVVSQKPFLFRQMGTMKSGPGHELGLAYHLPGVTGSGFPTLHDTRSMAFAGGRVRLELNSVGESYSVSTWIWNGMPNDARPVTGYFFSRGQNGDPAASGDHLGIGGTNSHQGKLILFNGNTRNELLAGRTILPLRTWHHVVFVRTGKKATLYLNGVEEVSAILTPTHHNSVSAFLGGRSDNFANLEGRMDEVAIFDRALTPDEVATQFSASGVTNEAQK